MGLSEKVAAHKLIYHYRYVYIYIYIQIYPFWTNPRLQWMFKANTFWLVESSDWLVTFPSEGTLIQRIPIFELGL